MDDEILNRMKEVEQAVLTLDESVRSAAFAMMHPYILGGAATALPNDSRGVGADPGEDDLEAFFSGRDMEKPADAALAIAAYLFQQYGTEAFTLSEVKEIADQVGLTVPGRLDMTFKGFRRSGKPIFRTTARGKYAPTVLGETTLKSEFSVSKGRRKKVSEETGGS